MSGFTNFTSRVDSGVLDNHLGKSTACEIVNDVCEAIVDVLLSTVLKWPTGGTLRTVLDGFLQIWGFPQCAGAIDGTHIPIVAPPQSSTDYYNRKGFYSIVLQAVLITNTGTTTPEHQSVESEICRIKTFTDINIKWPGKVHDARILANSGIFRKAEAGLLFPDITVNISGCDVPVMLIGDPAYPLLPWLMKRYTNNGNLSQDQKNFNYRLSRARQVVECAFGRLKNRYRCLLSKSYTCLDYLPIKVAACCVLHNICEMRADNLPDMLPIANNDETVNVTVQIDNANAEVIRDSLREYFKTN